jgi:hypothetical protein
MLPGLIATDHADGRGADIEYLSHGFLRQTALSDPQHIGLSEFGMDVSLTLTGSSPFNHFLAILRWASEMQTARMNTDRSIAPVQDTLSVGGTVMNSVGSDVGAHGYPIHRKTAISATGKRPSRPVPAAFDGWIIRHEPSEYLGLREVRRTVDMRSTRQRIAIFPPFAVVGGAPVSGMNRTVAVRNDAHVIEPNGSER